jgi:hypothetical protein
MNQFMSLFMHCRLVTTVLVEPEAAAAWRVFCSLSSSLQVNSLKVHSLKVYSQGMITQGITKNVHMLNMTLP